MAPSCYWRARRKILTTCISKRARGKEPDSVRSEDHYIYISPYLEKCFRDGITLSGMGDGWRETCDKDTWARSLPKGRPLWLLWHGKHTAHTLSSVIICFLHPPLNQAGFCFTFFGPQ